MAHWILNRPAELANVKELRVAEYLAQLDDDWVIRWGFYYQDNLGNTREGDFLVLGPHGGLLVLEVKGGSLDFYPATGSWQTEGRDHPLFQLDMEWRAVRERVNAKLQGRPSLYVGKALAVPDLELAAGLDRFHDIPRKHLFTRGELKNFGSAWGELFHGPAVRLDGRSRELFFETFAQEVTPKVMRHFISSTDRALMRQTEGNYELLEQLADNRQFLIRGGAGSGKTWMAFELACRWAELGRRVLLLCYNLALTDFLRELATNAARRGRPARGEIVVRSWEEQARTLVVGAGLHYDLPEDGAERARFYTEVLPDLLRTIVREGLCAADFDALVVDEGQDHDTEVPGFPADWEGPGWWGIYWRSLREGRSAPVAVFYDPAQRPIFRNLNSFAEDRLYEALGRNPVKLRLLRTLRYTRPVFEYLRTLEAPATRELVAGLVRGAQLNEGPGVETVTVSAPGEVRGAVDALVERWVARGMCHPEDILVISQHGRIEKSVLNGCVTVGGHLLVDYLRRKSGCVNFTSANRAKGLDSLAVILVDFAPFAEITEPMVQISYFLGASRARQLLAVVHARTVETTTLAGAVP